jgi:hypothetical protein
MSRRLFHYFCVILLLIAQQGAIAHATWHAGSDARAHDSDSRDHANQQEMPGAPASLCAFDLAFGQVLGGVHGSCAAPVVSELPAALAAYVFNPRLGSEAVPAHSRGPPISL